MLTDSEKKKVASLVSRIAYLSVCEQVGSGFMVRHVDGLREKKNFAFLVSHIGYLAVCAQVEAAQGTCPQKTSGAILGSEAFVRSRSLFDPWWTAQAVNIVCAFHLAFPLLPCCSACGDDPLTFHDAGVQSTPFPNVMVMWRLHGELFNAEQTLEEFLAAFSRPSATRRRGVPAIAVHVLAMFFVAFTLLTQRRTKKHEDGAVTC